MCSPFDHIPDEILVDILKHLDVKSLKEAALVCKRWSDVIDGSPKLMHRMVLKISSYGNRDLSEVLNLQRKFVRVYAHLRKYRALHVPNSTESQSEPLLMQAIEHVAPNITHFHVHGGEFNRTHLTSIFKSMPELITIVFDDVDIRGSQELPIQMKNLKEISASYTTWSLLEIITAPSLTYLNINGLNSLFCPIRFMRFIETTKSLQTLIVRTPYEHSKRCGNGPSWYCNNFLVFYETLGSIDYLLLPRLVTLTIGSFTRNSWDPYCKFISKRSSTLTKLTLDWGYTNDQPKEAFAKILQIVFGDLKCLKELTIGSVLRACPDDTSILATLKLNKSIESLNLSLLYKCSQKVFEKVLGVCTGLKSLELRDLTEEEARFVVNNLKLTKLSVATISFQDVHFPTLKILEITDLHRSQWQNFLKINSTVETLIARRIESQVSPTIDYILDETNIKHLTIQSSLPISADVNRKLQENPKGLVSLEWICRDKLWRKPRRLFFTSPINRDLGCANEYSNIQ